jgi:tetratricopeptide (TPR) repeat protein
MANELVIADTYYNRTTAMGYGYRGFQENLVKSQTGEITSAMRENSNREIAATVASAGLVAESVRRMETGITTAIDGQTEVMQAGFDSVSNTLEAGFYSVGNTLEAGFERVTNQLGRMSVEMNMGFARTEAAIDRLSTKICARLDKIANILETPRGTAARELYNNAFANYRKGFYAEALPDVQKAVEMLTADYLSWFLEGKIYAFGAGEFSNVIDLDKSIAAYANAAKYISPDAEKSEDAKRLAAEIRFYLGLAQYAKSNESFRAGNQAESDTLLSAARDSFLRSYQYSDLMLEARYNVARCKALLGDISGALADLEVVISEDAVYCVKAEMESDFDVIRGDYHRLIEKMRDELYGEAAPVYKEITEGYELAKQEGLTHYFEKTVQITQDVPVNFDRSGITSSGVAGYGIELINNATIPLFEQCISAGLEKSLPYLDMRVRIPPYPVLLNVLRRGMAIFQTKANDYGGVTIMEYGGEDTQVVIPRSIGGNPVTAIGERAFEQKQLTSIVIPSSVTIIEDHAFSDNQLTNAVIPDSVKNVGNFAFYRNQLKDVTIGSGVTNIGKIAFGENQLTSVAIPNSVTTIGGGAFGQNQLTNVVIPDGVTTIRDYTFSGNHLTNVVIPDSVTTIEDSAFSYNQLMGVVIPNSVKTIGDNAFSYNQLKDVTIGENVSIGDWGSDGSGLEIKTKFDSSYNKIGKKAGKYLFSETTGNWYNVEEREKLDRESKRKSRRDNRWITIGILLGLVPLVGGFVVGHWFIGILIGIATAVVGAIAFLARGWGILALALIGGGIRLGIHLGHPFIGGIIAVIAGLVVWGVGVSKS